MGDATEIVKHEEAVVVAYDALSTQIKHFRQDFMHDTGKIWLPSGFEPSAQIVCDKLTQLWFGEFDHPLPPSGLVCASSDLLDSAMALNSAKKQFEAAVIALRKASNFKQVKVGNMVLGVLKSAGRPPTIEKALKKSWALKIDLQAAYKFIPIINPGLTSISWTWAMRHTSVHRISKGDALDEAKNITNPSVQKTVEDLIAKDVKHVEYAQVKQKQPQLRANLKYVLPDHTVEREAKVTSNILLLTDAQLPEKIKWRDRPEEEREKIRSDKQINISPFIHALNLYVYDK